jgi:hypothetical protein
MMGRQVLLVVRGTLFFRLLYDVRLRTFSTEAVSQIPAIWHYLTLGRL